MAPYRLRDSPFGGETEWRIEADELVRRSGGREARWRLGDLTRMTLSHQVNRFGSDIRFAELSFGRRKARFSSRGWRGIGRPCDLPAPYGAFVRALAAEGARQAPKARFHSGGSPGLHAGAFAWAAGLLALATVALLAMALFADTRAMGLDLAARLAFVLMLLFAAAPWTTGLGGGEFDPMAVPDELAPRD